jgi:hypothetical protein
MEDEVRLCFEARPQKGLRPRFRVAFLPFSLAQGTAPGRGSNPRRRKSNLRTGNHSCHRVPTAGDVRRIVSMILIQVHSFGLFFFFINLKEGGGYGASSHSEEWYELLHHFEDVDRPSLPRQNVQGPQRRELVSVHYWISGDGGEIIHVLRTGLRAWPIVRSHENVAHSV